MRGLGGTVDARNLKFLGLISCEGSNPFAPTKITTALANWTSHEASNFDYAGSSPAAVTTEGLSIGKLICLENRRPKGFVRSTRAPSANLRSWYSGRAPAFQAGYASSTLAERSKIRTHSLTVKRGAHNTLSVVQLHLRVPHHGA